MNFCEDFSGVKFRNMSPMGSNDKIDPMVSSYIIYGNKFAGESENFLIRYI